LPLSDQELDKLLQSLQFTIRLHPEDGPQSFSSFADLNDFYHRELQFCNTLGSHPSHDFFQRVVAAISEAKSSSKIDDARMVLEDLRKALPSKTSLAGHIVYSQTRLGQFLKSLKEEGPQLYHGATEYLKSQMDFKAGQHQFLQFQGAIRTALILNPRWMRDLDFAEGNAVETLREKAQSLLSEVIGRSTSLKTELKQCQDEQTAALRKLITDSTDELNSLNKEWRNSLREMEDTYREKLRLEQPTEYWRGLETRYEMKGRIGVLFATLLVVGFWWSAQRLVYNPPAAWSGASLTPAGVKSAILLAVSISAVAYLLHLTVRLSTSSYHLARDARERLQLTYMFLALLKDGKVTDKEREIVFTALFSRSDTGLLKDGTPAMPGPFGSLAEFFRK